MVNSLTRLSSGLALAALLTAALLLGTACASQAAPEPTATPVPTPTPALDPAVLLTETAASMRATQSLKFSVTHETGSIYIVTFSAKVTDVAGSWDANLGADFTADAYLVSGPDAEPTSGTYVQMPGVITPDAYYLTDPLSGTWIKQLATQAPIPVDRLAEIVADMIMEVGDPVLVGQDMVDDVAAYQISGAAPASVMDWLPLTAEAGQTLQLDIWTDVEGKVLRRLRATGAVGEFDQPDTVRSITLTNINEPVTIEPPDDYIDLTGG